MAELHAEQVIKFKNHESFNKAKSVINPKSNAAYKKSVDSMRSFLKKSSPIDIVIYKQQRKND